jgi:hypothetical protein
LATYKHFTLWLTLAPGNYLSLGHIGLLEIDDVPNMDTDAWLRHA